jgi:hypothetical protein
VIASGDVALAVDEVIELVLAAATERLERV